ncbi:MAG: hypothetical protein EOM68_26525 [Spirochaetia bacterium]|nr:hypothetical protein [Spirochaetia bacterium]
MNYFFDQHFHVMNIAHPNLLSFFSSLDTGLPDLITSGALSPSYILTAKNRKGPILLNRMTKDGELLWEKTYGVSAQNTGVAVQETSDKRLLVLGNTGGGAFIYFQF